MVRYGAGPLSPEEWQAIKRDRLQRREIDHEVDRQLEAEAYDRRVQKFHEDKQKRLDELRSRFGDEILKRIDQRHHSGDEEIRPIAANFLLEKMANERIIGPSLLHVDDVDAAIGKASETLDEQRRQQIEQEQAAERARKDREEQERREKAWKRDAAAPKREHMRRGRYDDLRAAGLEAPAEPSSEPQIDNTGAGRVVRYREAIAQLVDDHDFFDLAKDQAAKLVVQVDKLEAKGLLPKGQDQPASLERASSRVMDEYLEFVRTRDDLKKRANAARDPERREILRCVIAMEAAGYMAKTNAQLADQGDILAGRDTSLGWQRRRDSSNYETQRTLLREALPVLKDLQRDKKKGRDKSDQSQDRGKEGAAPEKARDKEFPELKAGQEVSDRMREREAFRSGLVQVVREAPKRPQTPQRGLSVGGRSL